MITKSNDSRECDLTFNLLQLNLHLNLKLDDEIETFYETCKDSLIRIENKYENILNRCLLKANIIKNDNKQSSIAFNNANRVLAVLSDPFYLIILFLLVLLLGPYIAYYIFIKSFNKKVCYFKNKAPETTEMNDN